MLVMESRVCVEDVAAAQITDVLLDCTDDVYRAWWPGTHRELHRVTPGPGPGHVGDVVLMDEMVGRRHLRLTGVVTDAVPGRRIVWQLGRRLRLPVELALDLTDHPGGVDVRHTITAGWCGLGRIADPALRLVFTRRFRAAMDAHVRTEFPLLRDRLTDRARQAAPDARHLRPTPLLDTDDPLIQRLVAEQGWLGLPTTQRIGAIYAYVRDRIRFGYGAADAVPGSRVVAAGYGQCNTKTIALMALLRAVGVPCRFHAALIDKRVQRGILPAVVYPLAPRRLSHSWAEVWSDGQWVGLEGVILDQEYLAGLCAGPAAGATEFLDYGVATANLASPSTEWTSIEWTGRTTAIQSTAVTTDLGVFPDPDSYYGGHPDTLRGVRRVLFGALVRPWMNRRVRAVRRSAPRRSLLHATSGGTGGRTEAS
jgi:Transglutaminase-like superfamily